MITEEASFRALLSKRVSKNWGMVALFKCWVITLVLRPNTAQAMRDPIRALPMPAQVAAMPYFQPN